MNYLAVFCFQDCEPFWYDSSCDPRDRAGKNFFGTFDDCKKKCDGVQSEYVTPAANAESETEKVEEEEEQTEEEAVEEEEVTPSETTTTAPEEENEQHDFFFKVKPQNYLEDVLSTEKEDGVKHNGFNPNEFLKNNVEKVKGEELKKVIPKPDDVKEETEDKIEHDILDNLKKEGVIEKILSAPTTCELEYDADLRNECSSADWTELFYWNEQFKECEAFWYDSSCGDPDYEKKNLFKSYEDCNNKCVKKIGGTVKSENNYYSLNYTVRELAETDPTTTTTASTTTTTTATTTPKSTTPSSFLEVTQRPSYNQNNPLNLILNSQLFLLLHSSILFFI